MNNTCTQSIHQVPAVGHEVDSTLNRLVAALAAEEYRRRLFRDAFEEEQMESMRRPVSTRKAYALLGMLLGLLPPAAIFFRIFGYGFAKVALNDTGGSSYALFFICLVMNIACGLAGLAMGSVFGQRMDELERQSWSRLILVSVLLGSLWGLVSGAAGGLIFFGIGAFFGAACAIPVGALAFTTFTPLHRLLARGGMIEAGHFWPLACGVTMTVVALILSPHVFPY